MIKKTKLDGKTYVELYSAFVMWTMVWEKHKDFGSLTYNFLRKPSAFIRKVFVFVPISLPKIEELLKQQRCMRHQKINKLI